MCLSAYQMSFMSMQLLLPDISSSSEEPQHIFSCCCSGSAVLLK